MQLVIGYSLKIATVIFGLLFHKLLWLLAFFTWLLKLTILGVHIRPWLFKIIPTAADEMAAGRIYASLVWMHV